MTNFTKIITHGGAFHADEVLAIATLRHFGMVLQNTPIERTFKVSPENLANPDVLVLDIGGDFSPEKGNFDHHQDGALEATNVLVLRHILAGNPQLFVHLHDQLFEVVSDTDRGVIPNGGNKGSFNAIIRNLNVLENGFEIALGIAHRILTAYVTNAENAMRDLDRWQWLEKRGRIAIQEDTSPILGWKDLARETGISVLACPNARGGWQLISRDTADLVLPADHRQNFRHASGFMAVYDTKEAALAHASEIV